MKACAFCLLPNNNPDSFNPAICTKCAEEYRELLERKTK